MVRTVKRTTMKTRRMTKKTKSFVSASVVTAKYRDYYSIALFFDRQAKDNDFSEKDFRSKDKGRDMWGYQSDLYFLFLCCKYFVFFEYH